MARHLLKDVTLRNLKVRDKPYRLRDGDGLFLYVPPTGVAAWQYRYKLEGKSQTLTIGKLADMPLAEARKRAQAARADAADGKHLTIAKRLAKAKVIRAEGNTFKAMADSWIRRRRNPPWSTSHKEQVQASIDNHLATLYPLPVTEINAALVAPILERVERRAPLMFEKVRARLNRILDHAVTKGALERNPLPKPEPEKRSGRRHFPAVTNLDGVGAILRAARAADPSKGVQRAHIILAFTAQRVSEVVGAAWSEFDLDAGTWAIPRERMKQKDEERGPHEIPIPPTLLAQLREWRSIDGPDATLVCVAQRDPNRFVTPEGVEKFYRDALGLQGKHSPHSWRSAFSTIARDAWKDDSKTGEKVARWDGDVIEAQLDHVVGNTVASAYDRAKRFELRRSLMRWYEGQLIAARDGATIVPLTGTG